jgi:hypothetical protein
MSDFITKYNSEFGSGHIEVSWQSASDIGVLQYNNVFYSSYEDCDKQLSEATWSVLDDGNGDPAFFLASMSSSYDVTTYPIIVVIRDSAWCAERPSSDEFLNFMVSNGYQSALREGISDSFVNNPPYKCTVFETKSYLEILSQSFAIANTFIGVYLTLTRSILQSYPKYFIDATQRVAAEKSLDMMELNSKGNARE